AVYQRQVRIAAEVFILDKDHAVAANPLLHAEGAGSDEIPVIVPVDHVRGVAGGVSGEDGRETGEEGRIEGRVLDDNGVIVRAGNGFDLVVARRHHRAALWVDDRFPGENHVVTGERFAV